MPGTTRDAIEVEFQYKDRDYTLIDTAGLRRKGKVFEAIEKFSVIKTLQAIESSNVVVLLLDAHAGIAEQDANIAGYILESGRALVVGVNKWDSLDDYERRRVKEELERKLHFLRWAKIVYISALEKRGLHHLLNAVNDAHAAAETRFRMFRKATVDIWKAGSEINSNSRAHRSESNLERTRIPTPKRPNRRIPAECGDFYKEPRLKDAARSVPQISINNDLS